MSYNYWGKISTLNSSTATLNSGATFTGTGEQIVWFGSVVAAIITDQDGIAYMEFSNDNTNWDSSLSFAVLASTNEVHRLSITRPYYRIRFANTSANNQTYFRLSTIYWYQPALTSSLNTIVQQDADASIVRSLESEIDIASNKYVWYSIVNKVWFNPDIDSATVPEDIRELWGLYTWFPLTSGETITVVSSSVNDAAAGTWARTMRITWLDTNYVLQTEDFTLNGTTPVTGAKTFTRVHTAIVLTSGSSNTAFNDGIISVYHTTTTANVFLSMRVGTNQTNCSAYTVPAWYTAYVRNISVKVSIGSTNVAAADYSIWTQSALKITSPRLRRPNSTYYWDGAPDAIYGGIVFTEKSDLILRVTSVANNNTVVTGWYDLLLIKN